jgi:hypothetical protein
MADKVKFLKFENSASGGTQIDFLPTEAKPTEDYAAIKGVAFDNLDTFLMDKIGRAIVEKFPDLYHNVTYSGGDVSNIEFFNSASFITANRVARYDLTYSSGNLTSEVLRIYDTDGTTVLRTYTWAHTYSSGDFVSSGVVTT